VSDRAPYGVHQIQLAADAVRPRRRIRVLEVRHEHVRARVERVDDHLAVDGTGDFDAAIDEIRLRRRDLPIAAPHVLGLIEEPRLHPGVVPRLNRLAALEQLFYSGTESTGEIFDKGQGWAGEDAFAPLDRRARGANS